MRSICTGTAAAVLMAAATAAWADEKVDLDKVPKAVVDAVKAALPDAEIKGAEKETEDGKLFYEIEILNKKEELDVEPTPDGDLSEIEKEIDYNYLPKAVSNSLEDKYPKAEFKEVEEVTKVEKKTEKLAYYEVQVKTADQKRYEVQVAPDGKVVNEQKKDKKD